MSQQVFAQFIEMAPATLSSIFNGRTRPTLNIVEAIKKKIPAINTDWLMFGTGPMYISDTSAAEAHPSPQAAPSEPALDFDTAVQPTALPPSPGSAQMSSSSAPYATRYGARPEIVREEIKVVEKPQRKITEIRVYFDDLTFETFVPAKSK